MTSDREPSELLKSEERGNAAVVISGGTGALGSHYARALSEDGYHVILLDVQPPRTDLGRSCRFFECDITSAEGVAELGVFLVDNEIPVVGLINNASVQPAGFHAELEQYDVEVFRRVLHVNVVGSFLLTKTVIPIMRKMGKGSIINIGSIQGVVAPTFEIYKSQPFTSPLVYSVSKAALIHFARWVAARYGSFNIRCNAISPGGVQESQHGDSIFVQEYSRRTYLGRMARVSDVTEVVRFLISDKSAYITGQNIIVDGGWTAS